MFTLLVFFNRISGMIIRTDSSKFCLKYQRKKSTKLRKEFSHIYIKWAKLLKKIFVHSVIQVKQQGVHISL